MKKILVSSIIILIILSIAISSYAVEVGGDTQEEVTPKIEVKFKAAENNNENTIKLVLSLGKFTDIKENAMIGYEAKLNYEEEIFETVEAKDVKGLNGWTATYSPITKAIIGDPIVGKEDTEIVEITLTLKEGVETEKATVSLTNFLLSDDDENELYTTDLPIEITIKNQEPQPQPQPEIPNDTTETTGDNNGTQSTTKIPTDTTTANTSRLPKAGNTIIIISIIAIICIAIGTVSGKGYIGYLKDTHKQIKKQNKNG